MASSIKLILNFDEVICVIPIGVLFINELIADVFPCEKSRHGKIPAQRDSYGCKSSTALKVR